MNTTIQVPDNTSISYEEYLWGPRRDSLIIVVPITVLYMVIFIVGFFGNIITCVVIIRNKHMQTATNYYLISLAISDLLLLITGLPIEMVQIWHKYPYLFGEVTCMLQAVMAETSMNATVLTITSFTVERYVAICHPFLSHAVSNLSRATKYIFAIWITAFSFALPQALQMGIVYGLDYDGNIIEELSVCGLKAQFIPHSFEVSTIVFFVLPMSVITVLYVLIGLKLHRPKVPPTQDKHIVISSSISAYGSRHQYASSVHTKATRNVIKMLAAVVVAFFICWAPFHLQRLFAVYGYGTGDNISHSTVKIFQIITYISGILYYFSTVVNPVLYNIMSNKFRRAFQETIRKCRRRLNRRNSGEIGNSRNHNSSGYVSKHESSSSKNSYCDCNNGKKTLDLSQRPVIVSFRKGDQNDNIAIANNSSISTTSFFERVENKNKNSSSAPFIFHPNCKCKLKRKKSLNLETNTTSLYENEKYRESV